MTSYVALASLMTSPTWLVGDRQRKFDKRRVIMGVLNVTPDSFSDGGDYYNVDDAVAWGIQMIKDGADIIDVGGESTRPGATPVTAEEELNRVIPVIKRLASHIGSLKSAYPHPTLISIDTSKAIVAREAIKAGAQIVNDISGLGFDPDMAATVAELKASLVLMHIQGTPETMESQACYGNVVEEVKDYFVRRLDQAEKEGIDLQRIAIDPGIGFGKTTAHNYRLLRELASLTSLGRPIVLGTSRKRMIGEALGGREPKDRVWGTAATIACGIFSGANIVRVHDVKEMNDVVRVTEMLVQSSP